MPPKSSPFSLQVDKKIRSSNFDLVSVDLEMTGLAQNRLHRPYGDLVCASICPDGKRVFAYTSVDRFIENLNNLLGACLAFHNGVFDVPHIRRWLDIAPRPGDKYWDTLLIERILWGGWFDGFGLDDCARRWLDLQLDKSVRKSFEDFDAEKGVTEEQLTYNAMDAYATWHLAIKQMAIVNQNQPRVFPLWCEIESPAAWAIMDLKGFKIDKERWLSLAKENKQKADGLEAELGFNPASSKQTVAALRKAGCKVDSSGEEVLEQHLDHPIVQKILKFREYDKKANAYGQRFLDRLMEEDDKIYASYNPIGAETGRMSSGMQQIPREVCYRECFTASKSGQLIIADYSAQEPRLLAQISRDEELMRAFASGEDVHLSVTRVIFDDPNLQKGDERELQGKMIKARQVGKAVNLASSYGMTEKGLALKLGCSNDKAREILATYFKRFTGVTIYINDFRQKAATEHFVNTLGGRQIWVNPYNYKSANNAINGPIQGSAAEVTKLALAYLHKEYGAALPVVGIIHDEIVLDVPKKEVKKHVKILQSCMERAFSKLAPDISVKNLVDVSTGPNWSAKH